MPAASCLGDCLRCRVMNVWGSLVQIYANRQEIGAHGSNERGIETRQTSLPLSRVILRQKMRRSSPPPPAHADANAWINSDVAHVTGTTAMLRNDPESVPLEPIPDGITSRKTTLTTGCLEQRPPRHVPGNARNDGIGSVLGKSPADGPLIYLHHAEATPVTGSNAQSPRVKAAARANIALGVGEQCTSIASCAGRNGQRRVLLAKRAAVRS
jgi:hypothetical protein